RCTRRYRVAIAAMPNSGPGEVPEAALTRETVAKERRGETEQSVVVKRQHNRPLRGGCADDRRREQREEVVTVSDVGGEGPRQASHCRHGPPRPHRGRTHRRPM